MYSLLGRDVLTLCDKYCYFLLHCEGCPDQDVLGPFLPRCITLYTIGRLSLLVGGATSPIE